MFRLRDFISFNYTRREKSSRFASGDRSLQRGCAASREKGRKKQRRRRRRRLCGERGAVDARLTFIIRPLQFYALSDVYCTRGLFYIVRSAAGRQLDMTRRVPAPTRPKKLALPSGELFAISNVGRKKKVIVTVGGARRGFSTKAQWKRFSKSLRCFRNGGLSRVPISLYTGEPSRASRAERSI